MKIEQYLKKTILIASILHFVLLTCCEQKLEQNADPAYLKEINEWHAKRIANLKKESGWLNLVGLYWLKQGENKFGSAKNNDNIFPGNAPEHIGTIVLIDTIATFKAAAGVKVFSNDAEVNEITLQNDLSENPTILKIESFRFFIIKRGDRFGIRLRDLESPLLKNFQGIERFPVNVNWRIKANFIKHDSPKKISVPNVLGEIEEEISSGRLEFVYEGKPCALDPVDSGDRFFVIFADETNGESTYGAGRFLYTDKPDSNGVVILDFNKAYNPPCVFTEYATCPLPPRQNRLNLKVTAGEMVYGSNH